MIVPELSRETELMPQPTVLRFELHEIPLEGLVLVQLILQRFVLRAKFFELPYRPGGTGEKITDFGKTGLKNGKKGLTDLFRSETNFVPGKGENYYAHEKQGRKDYSRFMV